MGESFNTNSVEAESQETIARILENTDNLDDLIIELRHHPETILTEGGRTMNAEYASDVIRGIIGDDATPNKIDTIARDIPNMGGIVDRVKELMRVKE